MKAMKLVFMLVMVLVALTGCSEKTTEPTALTGTVTDVDGKVYDTVKIGNQWWMTENLEVTKYRDGTPIPNVTDNETWTSLSTGAYCYYDNNSSNGAIYGPLYNFHAVNDPRGLAPEGWRVASDEDWKALELYLGMTQSQANDVGWRGTEEGKKLKKNSELWNTNTGTDDEGFGALPGGFRYNDHRDFDMVEYYARFWTSTPGTSQEGWYRILYGGYDGIARYYAERVFGYSVRCIKE